MSETRDGFARRELDPPSNPEPLATGAAPPEAAAQRRADDEGVQGRLEALIGEVAGEAPAEQSRLVRELMTAALKLIPDGRDTGELKLMTTALKEMRYAYRVFGQYATPHKVTIFGSARTPPDHPDYHAAVRFSRLMAEAGWMVITGAGDGIMKAGHEGPGREASFGVAIRLPFETTANTVIHGDEKLINFRYFFTRKLMFLSQAEAVVVFPGGFGTQDELFETLTLVQTGKAAMVPIVVLEGHDGGPETYWDGWYRFIREQLADRRMINPEDFSLIHHAPTPEDAVRHVLAFYRNYHSCRYVRDELCIRLRRPITEAALEGINRDFGVLVRKGGIRQEGPHRLEDDHLDLPRIRFLHTRRDYGIVRRLIDVLNEAPVAEDVSP